MKIGILTSSRADFGIYLPLLHRLIADSFFETEIIAFGTHLSDRYGNTINEILDNNFEVKHRLKTLAEGDSPEDIALSIGESIKVFSSFWNTQKFDLVFALGDRYEMFAAVVAGTPFNLKFAHIAAGETTLGAIDNSYRHSISLMSDFLFVSAHDYQQRAVDIIQNSEKVFNVGALNIDNLIKADLYTLDEFRKTFNIDLDKPTILSTFHPETISYHENQEHISNLLGALGILANKYQIVITMPNSDTSGLMIRDEIEKFASKIRGVFLIESFGMKGYLSCMKYCSFLLGNTSSGFVEASFFPKYVINLGDRQKGRIVSPNIYSIPVIKDIILQTVDIIEHASPLQNLHIYGNGDASEKIVSILKQI
jgi:GDP/UDP-N,N'-diacetylbacillosamine 2-epimerase (hydrolysing)